MRKISEISNGKIIRTFSDMHSIKDAGLSYRGIYGVANGLQRTHKGREFIYTDQIKTYKKETINYRLINKYTKAGILVKQYKELKDVEMDMHNSKLVHRCINNYHKSVVHDGFIFLYDDNKHLLQEYINIKDKRTIRSKKVKMTDGVQTHTFNSLNEAERNGYYASGILYSIKKNKTYLGYRWEYLV